MQLRDLQVSVRRRYTTDTTLADDITFNGIVAEVVRRYSDYNPRVLTHSYTTEVDEHSYDLPEDCIMIMEVLYWPIGEVFAEMNAAYEPVYLQRRPERYSLISEPVIDDIKRAAYIKRLAGYWEQRGKTIYIYPAPTSASSLDLVYGAEHVLNDDEDGYDTIPDEDFNIIRNLIIAEVVESRMLEISLEADYAEGLGRVTKHFIPANAWAVVSRLRRGVAAKYGNGNVVITS